MPVRTRSQRLKEELTSSSSNGSEPSITMSAPRRRTKKSSSKATPSKGSKTVRESKRKSSSKEEMEVKSEEITPPTPTFSTQSDQHQETEPYSANVDEFRKYVKTILDSPNKVDLPKKQSITPSPRIERITIQHKKDQKMEFLIPPKQKDEPIEIRERIRAVLSPDTQPATVPFEAVPKSKSKSPSYPPIYNESSQLWSPNVPSYSEEEAERISQWLIILIFSILSAVFISYYQHEIASFLKSQLTPLGQSLNQFIEWISGNISSVWSSILSGNNDNGDIDGGVQMEDVVDSNINVEGNGDVTR